MKLNRTPDGKFCDSGSLLHQWLPRLLELAYGADGDIVSGMLKRAAWWLQQKAGDRYANAADNLKRYEEADVACNQTWALNRAAQYLATRDALLETAAKVREIWQ